MAISATQVKALRDKTYAPMMECKRALEEADGDAEKATDILRKRGQARAEKKMDRVAAEGIIAAYIHPGGQIGVLVEVNCETDFVARTDVFQNFVKDITMHIAAADPQYLRPEDVPAEVLEREKKIYREQVTNKPPPIVEKIVEGKMRKFYEQFCLLNQRFIKDSALTIEKYLKQKIAELGENIVIRQFVRYKIGERTS